MTLMKSVFIFLMAQPIKTLGILLFMLIFNSVSFCHTMSFCIYMHVPYVYFLPEYVLSCSSRTAIDVLECRVRSCYCLSLNKRFVVVVVLKTVKTKSEKSNKQ